MGTLNKGIFVQTPDRNAESSHEVAWRKSILGRANGDCVAQTVAAERQVALPGLFSTSVGSELFSPESEYHVFVLGSFLQHGFLGLRVFALQAVLALHLPGADKEFLPKKLSKQDYKSETDKQCLEHILQGC